MYNSLSDKNKLKMVKKNMILWFMVFIKMSK